VAVDFRRDGVRSSLVWDVLSKVVSARVATTGRPALDIVDVGGGTGGLAVPFAALGHNVTVVDPSPDALAAAQRRAAEAAARLTSVQGEAASLDSVVGPGAADLVICHNVLEYVEEPADAMSAIARVLRPSATVSVIASNAVAAVLHRALAGRFAEARRLLISEGTTLLAAGGKPTPRTPLTAPTSPLGRRFTLPELIALVERAGLRAGEAHGLRIFGGLVPGALLEGDAAAAEALRALEEAAASTPPLRDIAAQLHVLGHR
jgi:S-adenosylmethionine-dependent methyltransferase